MRQFFLFISFFLVTVFLFPESSFAEDCTKRLMESTRNGICVSAETSCPNGTLPPPSLGDDSCVAGRCCMFVLLNLDATCTMKDGSKTGTCRPQSEEGSGKSCKQTTARTECNYLDGLCCLVADGSGSGGGTGGSCAGKTPGASCTTASNQRGTCKSDSTGTLVCQASGGSTGGGNNPPGTGGAGCPEGFEKRSGVCFPLSTGLPEAPDGIAGILGNLLNWLLYILGFIGIIAFIISGLQYLFSAGDEGMAETAKKNIKYSIIGIVIALSGLVIIRTITAILTLPFFIF